MLDFKYFKELFAEAIMYIIISLKQKILAKQRGRVVMGGAQMRSCLCLCAV